MKRKIVAVFLAVLLLASLFPASALAEKGPFDPGEEGFVYSFIRLEELDENGEPIMETDEEGFETPKFYPIYLNDKITEQAGASYDKKTNTLTLTDFGGKREILNVNLMGDDFTIVVRGNCNVAQISVSGGGIIMQPQWGDSLHITGDGTLEVNTEKIFDSGIHFWPQAEEKTVLSVDGNVKLTVRGKKTAVAAEYVSGGDVAMTENGRTVALEKKNVVQDVNVSVPGFSNPFDWHVNKADCAADPDGLYDLREWYSDEEATVFSHVTVQRFLYLDEIGYYVVDPTFGGDEHELRFDSLADAEAAGYSVSLDEKGERLPSVPIKELGNFSTAEFLYEDANGKRYTVTYDYHEEEPKKVALEMIELAALPGYYAFLPAEGVDPASLKEITERRTLEEMFEFAFPGVEYVYNGAAPAVLLGDVDDDKSITAADARLALRRAVELETYAPGSREYIACDVDKADGVTAADARLILRAAVELEDPTKW